VKQIIVRLLILTVTALVTSGVMAQSITSNTTWTSGSPAPCTGNCGYVISAGVTLTIDYTFGCLNCSFTGGTIVMDGNVTCLPCSFIGNTITVNGVQLLSNNKTTTLTGTTVNVINGGNITTNTPLNITGSSLAFSNTSYLKNAGKPLTISGSSFTFNDNSYFTSTSDMNIELNSHFVIGDGTSGSQAYFSFTGSNLNIYDNSYISVLNKKNYYFNWGAFNYYTTTSSGSSTSYSLSSPPTQFGCAMLNSSGITVCTVLPVSLSSFDANEGNNGQVALSWTTQQEVSFDHFNVERSTDGENWETLAIVKAKGYSSTATDYSYTDASSFQGTRYYRLQMVDIGGGSNFSKILTFRSSVSTDTRISIFPNPITNLTFNVKVPTADATIVRVYTMEGRLLYTTSFTGQNQYQVKLPAAAEGTSFLAVQVISGGTTQSFNVLNH
jgi:hypothetical protein